MIVLKICLHYVFFQAFKNKIYFMFFDILGGGEVGGGDL